MNNYNINNIFSNNDESLQDIVEKYLLMSISIDLEGNIENDTNF